MRMTVALDHDVVVLLEEAVGRQRRSKRHVVNDALRQALSRNDDPSPTPPETNRALSEPDLTLKIDPQDPARLADRSDEEAISVALAHFFGLTLPTPRLYVVKNCGN
ncbi:ribbon-helix-helix domain-containing protein [Nocardia sp. CA2R105]|uniref:ribbon-helix-helix domain-containing protein n=1 Tax=Nocardia coffeae TaxID=2873381 RepID=UPI001CA5F573|nr:CopG family transcriptional regulator [Nocardia coffeae]MBY8864052.1 ribbon-helix-helix domain-containing protein [Nocardia coffeae]